MEALDFLISYPITNLYQFIIFLDLPLLVANFCGEFVHSSIDFDQVDVLALTDSNSDQSDWRAWPEILIKNLETDVSQVFVRPYIFILLALLDS